MKFHPFYQLRSYYIRLANVFKSAFLLITFFHAIAAAAQPSQSTDYFASIEKHNLTNLWRADSIQVEGDGEKIAFPEPIGFIGDNYQRFYIHYSTVTRNKENPYQYRVHGKTKVKNNICSFSGTITVRKAMLRKERDDPRYQQGTVICDILLYEDSMQAYSGTIKGTLTSNFYLDKTGSLRYDAIVFAGDGFSNNECIATWTSYKTGKSRKCHWGDFRIPESGDLDVGVGEFIISDKFIRNGWENYMLAWSGDPDNAAVQQARKLENDKWWQ